MVAPAKSVELIVPDRASERAQHYSRPGVPGQYTKTIMKRKSVKFGPQDFVEDFDHGQAFSRVMEARSQETRDTRHQNHLQVSSEAYQAISPIAPQLGQSAENLAPVNRRQRKLQHQTSEISRHNPGQDETSQERDSNQPCQVPAQIGNLCSNACSSPGLAHPGFYADTRGDGMGRHIPAHAVTDMTDPFQNIFETNAHQPTLTQPNYHLGAIHLTNQGSIVAGSFADQYGNPMSEADQMILTGNLVGPYKISHEPMASLPRSPNIPIQAPDLVDLARDLGGLQLAGHVPLVTAPKTPVKQIWDILNEDDFDSQSTPAMADTGDGWESRGHDPEYDGPGPHWPDPPMIYSSPQGMISPIEHERYQELLKEVIIIFSYEGETSPAGYLCPPVQYYRLNTIRGYYHPMVVDLYGPVATLEWAKWRNVNWRNNRTCHKPLELHIFEHHQRDKDVRFMQLDKEADDLADVLHRALVPSNDRTYEPHVKSLLSEATYRHRNVPRSPTRLSSGRGRNCVRSVGMDNYTSDEKITERVFAGGFPKFEGGKTFNEMIGIRKP